MIIVVLADALIILERAHFLRHRLAEGEDRVGGLVAIALAHVADAIDDMAINAQGIGIHRHGLEAEAFDQFAQRVRPDHRVIIDFGDALLIHRAALAECLGDDLATQPVGRLEDRDLGQIADFFLDVEGVHQPAGAAANNRQFDHGVFRSCPNTPGQGRSIAHNAAP